MTTQYCYELTERIHRTIEAAAARLGVEMTLRGEAGGDETDDQIDMMIGDRVAASVQSGPYGYGLNEQGYLVPRDENSFYSLSHLVGADTTDAALSSFAEKAVRKAIELASGSA